MESGFFKWVWRFNGIMIGLGSALVIGLLLWEMTRDFRRSVFPTSANDVVTLTDDGATAPEAVDQRLYYGATTTIGQDRYAIPIYADQTYDVRFVSKASNSLVNYLLMDGQTGETRTLFEGSLRVVAADTPIWPKVRENDAFPMGRLMRIIETDTDENSQLSGQDDGRLIFVSDDCAQITGIAVGVSQFGFAGVTDSGNEADVIVNDADGTRLVRFNLETGAVMMSYALTSLTPTRN